MCYHLPNHDNPGDPVLESDRTDEAASFQSASPAPPPPMLYELRPLSLGEILDRAFSLYRARFWLYVGLASFASAITTIGIFVRLTWGFTGGLGRPVAGAAAPGPKQILVSVITPLVTSLIYFLAYSITQAATVSAVSDVYLGHTASIEKSLNTVKRHWFRYFLIAWWQSGAQCGLGWHFSFPPSCCSPSRNGD